MELKKQPRLKNLFNNIPLLISGTAFAALNTTILTQLEFTVILVVALLIASFFLTGVYPYFKTHLSKWVVLLSFVTLFLFACAFYSMMVTSTKMQGLSAALNINVRLAAIFLAIAGAIASFYFCCTVIAFITDVDKSPIRGGICNLYPNFWRLPRILIAAGFLLLILCSLNASIWLDEAFSLRLIRYSYADVICYTSTDVHPPLYYLMLKTVIDICSHISSSFPFAVSCAKFFSVLSIAATALLCYKKFAKSETPNFRILTVLCLFSVSNIMAYATEIRMYGWAMFFVTASYLFAMDIADGKSTLKSWVLLIFFSLCSAYTHNFALVAVAILWIYLLILLLLQDRKKLLPWLLSGILTAAGYLPWLFVLFKQTKMLSNGYWIRDITFGTIVGYLKFLFPNILTFVPIALFFYLFPARRKKLTFRDCVGILIPLTTIVFGVIASFVLYPLLVNRYLIPCIFCLWISVLLLWCRLPEKQKQKIALLLICSCIACCISTAYKAVYNGYQSASTIKMIHAMEDDSVLYLSESISDGVFYCVADYTKLPVYFAGVNKQGGVFLEIYDNVHIVDENTNSLEEFLENGTTVYYLTTDASVEQLFTGSSADCTCLGTYTFDFSSYDNTLVYKIAPTP